MNTQLGKDIIRKEARNKVTGAAKYTNDLKEAPLLHAKLLTSPHAHAKIVSINTSEAEGMAGVQAVITASRINFVCGSLLRDRPPLAMGKVRYFGEPVAIVVAGDEQLAKAAVKKIKVQYHRLPVVNSIQEAIQSKPVLIHENLIAYQKMADDVYPVADTNICHHQKIRKGDMQKGWDNCHAVVEGHFKLPNSDHAAMETRVVRCTILPDGKVVIKSPSQAPFEIKELISEYFGIENGNVIVNVPLVGGAFGGKVTVQLEVLAVIASMAVGGRSVNLVNSREEDLVTSPCHLGLEAFIKLGANRSGQIMAAEMTFYVDSGAYADISPRMAKAIAVDCSGPYNIPNIHCDCYSVYTNHPYVTSFRGFGHLSLAFCLERMMEKLAVALNIDQIQFRLLNGVKEGDLTANQVKITLSNTGDIAQCLKKLKTVINWDEGARVEGSNQLVRAKGIGCFSKTSDSPTDASAAAIIQFSTDGSLLLDIGATEIGPGMKTVAAQILAEKMRMSIDRVFVKMDVDTQTSPILWKTVASMTTFMAGRAVLNAAEDTIKQLLCVASVALRCPVDDLDFGNERVYVKNDPDLYLAFKDIVHGYKYPDGNSVAGPIIGRGNFIMNTLTVPNPETGKGATGRSWTVGAQAVEIEYDSVQHTYRLLKAATVIDAGKVLNPKTAKGIIMGGMCMGLGQGTSEEFLYDETGVVQNTSFRTYKMLRYGETPDYLVEFVETPQIDAPFGARGIAEHGIIAIPAALANAVSLAAQIDVDRIPIIPEYIWRKKLEI